MCDISKKTSLKKVTVYKVVKVAMGEYFSYFSHKKLTVGEVVPLSAKELDGCPITRAFDCAYDYLKPSDCFYNANMVGRVSGFAEKNDAYALMTWGNVAILEIVLGGDIMEGTADNISNDIPNDHITYAGTEILSMKEV